MISTLFDFSAPDVVLSLSRSETRNTVILRSWTESSKVLVSLLRVLPSTTISALLAGRVWLMTPPPASKIPSSAVLPVMLRSLPSPDTPESIINLALPSAVLTMLTLRPKLSPLLLIFLRMSCKVSPAFTSTLKVLSPALNVSWPS
ncbi:hypothetical protein D3C78_939600 [compost metagenome]